MDGHIHLSFIGPGGPEILVVMLVLLVMFGAKDAPRIFRKLNDILNQFRRTAENFRHEMMYSDIKADSGADEDMGEYDDYGLSADEEADASDEADADAPFSDENEPGKDNDDVKSV